MHPGRRLTRRRWHTVRLRRGGRICGAAQCRVRLRVSFRRSVAPGTAAAAPASAAGVEHELNGLRPASVGRVPLIVGRTPGGEPLHCAAPQFDHRDAGRTVSTPLVGADPMHLVAGYRARTRRRSGRITVGDLSDALFGTGADPCEATPQRCSHLHLRIRLGSPALDGELAQPHNGTPVRVRLPGTAALRGPNALPPAPRHRLGTACTAPGTFRAHRRPRLDSIAHAQLHRARIDRADVPPRRPGRRVEPG